MGSPDHLYMEIPHETGKSGRKLSDAKCLKPQGKISLNNKHSTCTYLSFGDPGLKKKKKELARQHAAAVRRLLLSGMDGAAQPGAMGAPSYVQPDHWDQAAHSASPPPPLFFFFLRRYLAGCCPSSCM